MFFIGIDVSKDKIDCAYRTPSTGKAIYITSYTNDTAGFEQMTQELTQLNEENLPFFLTVEPSGGYERRVVHYGFDQKWTVAMPNPKYISDFKRASAVRGKTDPIDSCSICNYGAEKNPKPLTLLPAETEAMKDLLQRKHEIEKMIRAEKNRIKQYQHRPRQYHRVISSLEKIIETLDQELSEIEQEIKAVVKADPEIKLQIKRLLTLPGVGPKIVHWLYAFLSHCYALTDGEGSTNMVVAMAGLDPEPYTSGSSISKPPKISKKGDPLIRAKLYMGALGGLRGKGDNPLKDFYERLVGRGKAGKKALVAAARKILVWAWAIFTKEVDFDPALAGSKS